MTREKNGDMGGISDDQLVSQTSYQFYQKFYPTISSEEWSDYHWQLRKRYQSIGDFQRILTLSEEEKQAFHYAKGRISVSVTPYYASLMDINKVDDPLRRTVLPSLQEYKVSKGELRDPLAEDSHSPAAGIVHRYPDRVLFLTTDICPLYCRYCTRSRMVGGEVSLLNGSESQWKQAIAYIASNNKIRDVLISGGDPLLYSDDRLEWLLSRLRRIKHLDILRIGTKIPFVLPQRITDSLTNMLKKFHPLYMSLHVIHPREITLESSQACERLADAGIPLGSQTVLLKGINDTIEVIRLLMHRLLKIRVKPYYLLQCDPVLGSSHFKTPIQTGIDIIAGLRGYTSGYAVPHYIVDLPKGGGKVSLVPHVIEGYDDNGIIIKNYEGKKEFRYPDF